jgi:hypothetical protein
MRRSILAAIMVAAAGGVLAQKKAPPPAPPQAIEISGIVADAKGALANKIVRVGPLDAQGNMLGIRILSGSGKGSEYATSDAQGRFSITVGRAFFRNQAGDSIGVRVSTDIGGGRMSTAHKVAIVRFDSRQEKADLGRVVLEPLGAR